MKPLVLSLILFGCGAPAATTGRVEPRGRVEQRSNRIELREPIQFVGTTAELASASGSLLDAITETIRGNRTINKVQVRDHTAAGDLTLSKARADAVVAALVARGLPRERLVSAAANEGFRTVVTQGVELTIIEATFE